MTGKRRRQKFHTASPGPLPVLYSDGRSCFTITQSTLNFEIWFAYSSFWPPWTPERTRLCKERCLLILIYTISDIDTFIMSYIDKLAMPAVFAPVS